MSLSARKEQITCPVSGSADVKPVLQVAKFPLFQHPMDPATKVGQKYVTLDFYYCPQSGHCFQPFYDGGTLEELYSSHYYTPADTFIGASFREFFLTTLKPLVAKYFAGRDNLKVLEIGCSEGAMLADLQKAYPHFTFSGFEPNGPNSQKARDKGFEIYREFFTKQTAEKMPAKQDIIFSRHVVEHIWALDAFFEAATAVAVEGALLLHETPCLDWFAGHGKLDPFHVEHLHVFSIHSLAKAAARNGWYMVVHRVSDSGNLVAAFRRDAAATEEVRLPENLNMDKVKAQKQNWLDAIEGARGDKDVYLWGAGSFGLTVGSLLGGNFTGYLDGNENKEGLEYAGLDKSITYGPRFIERAMQEGRKDEILIVISSTFYREIRQQLRDMGWRGEILALSEVS